MNRWNLPRIFLLYILVFKGWAKLIQKHSLASFFFELHGI